MPIHTARMDYSGKDRLDITRLGGSPFGPSWALLKPHLALRREGKETENTWQQYVVKYTAEMSVLRVAQPHIWTTLEQKATEGVTLVCYCVNALRCHRTLLAEVLAEFTNEEYLGERIKANYTINTQLSLFKGE